MSDEMPNAQECKFKAILLIRGAEDRQTLEEQAVSMAAAQVWATLATVPEPLEELVSVSGQLIQAETPVPLSICEHGYAKRLVALPGGGHRIVQQDCPNGCAEPS